MKPPTKEETIYELRLLLAFRPRTFRQRDALPLNRMLTALKKLQPMVLRTLLRQIRSIEEESWNRGVTAERRKLRCGGLP